MKCTEEVSEYCREKIVVNKFAKEKICDECCDCSSKRRGRKVIIRCEYLDGGVREYTESPTHEKVLERILEAVKNKKGQAYYNFIDSSLSKVYVDGGLVLDRKQELDMEQHLF